MAISSNGVAGLRTGVCTSTTRPSGPYEGQMIYETDTDMVAIWNGTAWRYVSATTPTNGTVLQIVTATYSTVTSSSSDSYADTGLTVTITPKSSSSKIMLIVTQNGCWKSNGNSGSAVLLNLLRGSTEIVYFGAEVGFTGTALELLIGSVSCHFLDSPSTTSAVTYKTQFRNRVAAAAVQVQTNSAVSTITALEIAG